MCLRKLDTSRSKRTQNETNLIVPPPNYYEFGTKSITSLGLKNLKFSSY